MADIGIGAKFKIGDGASSEAFTALADIISINPPSISRASIDATNHDSADRYQEFIPGLRDAGEVSIVLDYTDTAYNTLKTKMDANTVNNYQVVGNDTADWEFSAFLTSLEADLSLDDRMTISCTFKVSGKPVFTAAA